MFESNRRCSITYCYICGARPKQRIPFGRPSWFHVYRGTGTQTALGTIETKMAAREGRSSISAILRKNRGLKAAYFTTNIASFLRKCKSRKSLRFEKAQFKFRRTKLKITTLKYGLYKEHDLRKLR